ncbi:MAG TPA: hypothetical protein EYF95_03930 [Flavobacteriales bacterium]|nr:hypothetical protein [Flavobacteriales bacterium]
MKTFREILEAVAEVVAEATRARVARDRDAAAHQAAQDYKNIDKKKRRKKMSKKQSVKATSANRQGGPKRKGAPHKRDKRSDWSQYTPEERAKLEAAAEILSK